MVVRQQSFDNFLTQIQLISGQFLASNGLKKDELIALLKDSKKIFFHLGFSNTCVPTDHGLSVNSKNCPLLGVSPILSMLVNVLDT